MTSAADSILGGRYRLTSPIAAGGMGEVWRATDELLGRQVAVKLLHSHVAADPSFRDRFRAEARITAALADPGIAQVFDYGESDGHAYLVMELVIGEPLSAILARHGVLDPQVALDVIQQTARGLHAAHRAGVIHRDIKPGNLLVTQDGQVKITDFGIARALEAAPLTRTGTVLGTVQYVSPEQATGSTLTSATDIYSLGVVAYECLTGRPPFVAETQVALAVKHINEQPPPLPAAVPPAVRALVFDMLAKQPSARPASGPELVNRVAATGEALSGTAEAESGSGRGGATSRTGEALAGTGTAALGMLTDPDGFPGSPERPTRTVTRPGAPASTAPQRRAARGGPGRGGPRRGVAVIAAAVGAAAAAAVGVLAFSAARTTEEPTATATASPSPVATPTRPIGRSSPTATVRASYPVAPVTPVASAEPSAVPSATVSTSAPPTQKPSPDPSPSPSPTPTPTPSPTLTPSEVPTPSVTPTDTSPPDEVGA